MGDTCGPGLTWNILDIFGNAFINKCLYIQRWWNLRGQNFSKRIQKVTQV